MGIVQAMVNVPHALPGKTRTAPFGNVATPFTNVSGWAAVVRSVNGSAIGIDSSLPHRKVVFPGMAYVCSVEATGTAAPGDSTILLATGYCTSSPPSALTTTLPNPAKAMI